MIFDSYRWDFILIFIDDIIIYFKILKEYLLYILLILNIFINIRMIIDEKKYYFVYINIELLGYRMNRLGLSI
jgi:hypothetical protein